MPTRPVLHGDNGASPRPRVSGDNAFAEALFRTAKYRPEPAATRSAPHCASMARMASTRTFSAVSTVAHSPHAGDALRQTPKSTAQRLRQ